MGKNMYTDTALAKKFNCFITAPSSKTDPVKAILFK